MNRLNRKLEYALMSLQLLYTHPEGKRLSTKDVCTKTGSPFDATARVMQVMAQKGLLRSEQGVKGGYYLARDLEQVTYLELVEMILGKFEVAKCISDVQGCEIFSKCNIKAPVIKINHKVRSLYENITLAELLKVDEEAAKILQPQSSPQVVTLEHQGSVRI